MNKNIHSQVINGAFKDYSETIWVFLKSSNTKGSNYDPYRKTGYTRTNSSPLPVKAIVHGMSSNSLIVKELGLISSGSIEVIVTKQDAELIKGATKIEYDKEEYTVYNKAVGNRVQIQKKAFDFYRIILFKAGN